jgi:hypothetical protein
VRKSTGKIPQRKALRKRRRADGGMTARKGDDAGRIACAAGRISCATKKD